MLSDLSWLQYHNDIGSSSSSSNCYSTNLDITHHPVSNNTIKMTQIIVVGIEDKVIVGLLLHGDNDSGSDCCGGSILCTFAPPISNDTMMIIIMIILVIVIVIKIMDFLRHNNN